jgi:hypothetical protein
MTPEEVKAQLLTLAGKGLVRVVKLDEKGRPVWELTPAGEMHAQGAIRCQP